MTEGILIVAYCILALVMGFKFVSGRSAWLDREKPLNMVVKVLVGFFVGLFIAAFYAVYLVLKYIAHLF